MVWGDLVQLLEKAALLMVLGMVIVFAILGLLVFMINLVARLLARWAPVADESAMLPLPATAASPSAAEVAAITAAIHQHRNAACKENTP